jgi:acyl carrier protein
VVAADRVKSVLVERLGIDEEELKSCSLETPLLGRGLGLDSVEVMSLAAGVENEFDIQIDDDDLTTELFQNLGTLARYVTKQLEDRHSDEGH